MHRSREKKRVLIPAPIHPDAVALLREECDVHVGSKESPEPFPNIESWHAILLRTTNMPAEVIRAAKNLEVIARHGVGVDNIDLQAASECGIPVVTTPEANAVSVAEHAVAMMIATAKRFHAADRAVRQGRFGERDSMIGVELHGKVLGIVGLGRVGSELARIARAGFRMEILAYDPFVDRARFDELDIRAADSLGALLSVCDFLSLHMPLTADTRGMIGRSELKAMKPNAIVINTARGGLVDEDALVVALQEGWIRGAALDVFEEEPPPVQHPLWLLDNLLLTPHTAAHTEEALRNMAMGAAERILEVFHGLPPRSVVNPEFREARRSPHGSV